MNYELLSFRVHRVNLLPIILVEHSPFELQRIRKLALFHREVVRQQRKPLDLLIVRQLLLKGVNALFHHLVDLWICTELLTVLEGDMMLTGILLQQRINGDDQRRHKLTLVSDDGYLINILIHQQLRLK